MLNATCQFLQRVLGKGKTIDKYEIEAGRLPEGLRRDHIIAEVERAGYKFVGAGKLGDELKWLSYQTLWSIHL